MTRRPDQVMRRETLLSLMALVRQAGGVVRLTDADLQEVPSGSSLKVLRAKGEWIIAVVEGAGVATEEARLAGGTGSDPTPQASASEAPTIGTNPT